MNRLLIILGGMHDVNHATCIAVLCFAVSAAAQMSTLKPVPLQEIGARKTPDNFYISPPWHCDLEGRVYVGVHTPSGVKVVRFDRAGTPEQYFPSEALPEDVKDFGITDYSVDPRGGMYVIAGKIRKPLKGPRFVILHFDVFGKFDQLVKLTEDFTPQKIAVFSNGALLIRGAKLRSSPEDHTTWLTAIFRQDGTIQTEVNLKPGQFGSSEETTKGRKAGASADEIGEAVEFISSSNGNIYAATISADDSPNFASQTSIIEITPGGDTNVYKLPRPGGAEIYQMVLEDDILFARVAQRDFSLNEVNEFFINHSTHRLDLIGDYYIVGAPQCSANGVLAVIRPAGPNHQYLVTYKH